LILYRLSAPSQSSAVLSRTSTSHPLGSYFHAFSTFFTFLLFSNDLSLRKFLHKPIPLSIKHKAFLLMLLAAFLSVFHRAPSAASQIGFSKQFPSTFYIVKFYTLQFSSRLFLGSFSQIIIL